MVQKHIAALLLGTASMMTMSGCSLLDGNSEYGCKGMPNSVTCMNVREVYALTDGDDYQEQVNTASEQQLAGEPVDVKNRSHAGGKASVNTSGRYVPVPAATANPQPIRTPSQVLRVLVDPYESADGDLNIPGYVYTEIEPRRWEVGARHSSTNSAVLRPMSTQSTTQSTTPPAK